MFLFRHTAYRNHRVVFIVINRHGENRGAPKFSDGAEKIWGDGAADKSALG